VEVQLPETGATSTSFGVRKWFEVAPYIEPRVATSAKYIVCKK
jgi:hypothetical protein